MTAVTHKLQETIIRALRTILTAWEEWLKAQVTN